MSNVVKVNLGLALSLVAFAMLCADASAGFPYTDRYEAWSANHAFPLGAWYEGENPPPNLTVAQTIDRYRNAKLTRFSATWTAANRTTYVPYVENLNMDWLLITPTAATYQANINQAMGVGSGPSAMIVADEPNNSDVDDVAARVKWAQQRTQTGVSLAQAPLVYANLSASGFNIDNYLIKAPVDVLSYDRYPLLLDGSTDSNYFKEMGIVRRKSLQYNVPTWMIQQAMGRPPGDGLAYRLPSESDMRFQAFSFLAHGGLGIDFFFYLTESFPNAIINHATNQPSEVYYSIQNMAPEILNLGRSLPRLRPVGNVEFLGQAKTEFDEVTPFVATASRKLYNIEGADSALVSYFKDVAGADYFMVVNLLQGAGLDKAEAADTFTLFLDPNVLYLRRLNRLTGQVETLPTIDNPTGGNRYLSIHLEGGTGDLFQFPTDTPFALVALAGDFDSDGDVDGADFVAWQTHFPKATGATLAQGDADRDGDVDGADFVIWQTHFPTTASAGIATVAEPCSLGLLAICGGALSAVGRRKLICRKWLKSLLRCKPCSLIAVTLLSLAGFRSEAALPTVLDASQQRVDLPAPTPPAVLRVDNAKQLLADDWVVEKMTDLKRTLHPIKKHPLNPLLKPEMPWEQPSVLLFGTVMYDPSRDADRFRMWYLCWTPKYSQDETNVLEKRGSIAYATSRDGLHWERPTLGLHEWGGNKQNNIVIAGKPDSTCILFDPLDPDPARRYKAQIRNEVHRGYFSPDGIHWTEHGPLAGFDGYDRSTVHWHPLERRWFASTKSFYKLPDGSEGRARGYQESKDFLHWNPVRFMCTTDDPAEIVYNLEPFFYESLFFGQWGRYFPHPDGLLDVQLAVSRNGRHWERPAKEAWIPLSPLPAGYQRTRSPNYAKTGVNPRDPQVPWDYGNNSASSLGPIRVGDELWIYYSGRTSDHHASPQTGAIGLGTMRLDGFFSLDAGSAMGTLVTRPLQLVNDTLRLNADAAHGELRVEIQDEAGNVIEPFTLDNCQPIVGDNVRHTVRWKGTDNLSSLADKKVRLKFQIKNASLYAFWTGVERTWATPDTTTWPKDSNTK